MSAELMPMDDVEQDPEAELRADIERFANHACTKLVDGMRDGSVKTVRGLRLLGAMTLQLREMLAEVGDDHGYNNEDTTVGRTGPRVRTPGDTVGEVRDALSGVAAAQRLQALSATMESARKLGDTGLEAAMRKAIRQTLVDGGLAVDAEERPPAPVRLPMTVSLEALTSLSGDRTLSVRALQTCNAVGWTLVGSVQAATDGEIIAATRRAGARGSRGWPKILRELRLKCGGPL